MGPLGFLGIDKFGRHSMSSASMFFLVLSVKPVHENSVERSKSSHVKQQLGEMRLSELSVFFCDWVTMFPWRGEKSSFTGSLFAETSRPVEESVL